MSWTVLSTFRRHARKLLQRPTTLTLLPLEDRSTPAVTGFAFQDFNANGVFETSGKLQNAGNGTTPIAVDTGLAGVTVRGFDANNQIVGTTTTGANGSFTLNTSGTGALRIEFSGLPAGFEFGPTGPGGVGSAIQFVPANAANVNLSVVRPSDYSPDNPLLATSVYAFGGISSVDGNVGNGSLLSFPYNAGTEDGDPNLANYRTPGDHALNVTHQNIGATWGLAYDANTNRLYAATYMKRHSGFGPGGIGAIYETDTSGNQATVVADLNALFSDFPAGNPNDIFRDGSNIRYDRNYTGTFDEVFLQWARDGTTRVRDAANVLRDIGWDTVGKTSLGGLDTDDAGSRLYTVALADRRLYSLPTGTTVSASAPARFDLPIPASVTGRTANNPLGDLRPFAVEYHRGFLYIGAVNSAETTGRRSDLKAYVFAFDPARGVFVNTARQATQTEAVLEIDLNYDRGILHRGGEQNPNFPNEVAAPDPAEWNAWVPTFRTIAQQPFAIGRASFPQPMLTGLAFDSDGNVSLGIRDRSGDQIGRLAADDPNDLNNFSWFGMTAGDTLKAFINTPGNLDVVETNPTASIAGWSLESNGRNPLTGGGLAPQNSGQGPGGGEYFSDDDLPRDPTVRPIGVATEHDEVTIGGVLQLPGSNVLASTSFDPARIPDRFNTGGVRFFDDATGQSTRQYELYETPSSPPASTFAKANGVGDLVAITAPPPIEIGNYIWADTNGNGLQDAGEAAVAGADVQLWAAGLDGVFGTADDEQIADATTDAAGEYYFASRAGTSTDNRILGLDLKPNTAYQLRLPTTGVLTNKQATLANVGSNGAIDSNAVSTPALILVNLTTGRAGQADHTFDLGIVDRPLVSLGDFVWNDLNNDGVLSEGEPAIDGVPVHLYAADGVTKLASTSTANGGKYLFQNLEVGTYIVEIVPPAGFASSTGKLGADGGPFEPGTTANLDNQDHGTNGPGGVVRSSAVTLFAPGSPNNPNGTGGKLNNANLTVDFGLIRPMSIGNFVFEDINNDGNRQDNEPGLVGATINLRAVDSNTVVASTTTNTGGGYLFPNLIPGRYQVEIVRSSLPGGFVSSTGQFGNLVSGPFEPARGDTGDNNDHGTTSGGLVTGKVVDLRFSSQPTGETATPGNIPDRAADADSNYEQDFGFVRTLSVGNFVWEDSDNDGTFDAGEKGIAGVKVQLFAGNTLVGTETTSGDGLYRFVGLTPGSYNVRITRPNGFISSTGAFGQAKGPFEPAPFSGLDNVDHGTDDGLVTIAAPFTLSLTGNPDENGTANLRQDFGLFRPLAVGNFVWEDVDNNGLFNGTDSPIANVPVELLSGGGVVAATTTNDQGEYRFNLVPAGTYTVRITRPAGFVSSTGKLGSLTGPFEPAPQSKENNVDHGTDAGGTTVTAPFELLTTGNPDENGTANLRQDFGLFRPLAVGNFVWDDVDNNGKLNGLEAGIPNVAVELTRDGAVVATAKTDATGGYRFDSLTPGTYAVRVVRPTGFVSSTGVNGNRSGPFEPAPQTTDNNVDHGTDDGLLAFGQPFVLSASGNPDENGKANLRQDFGLFRTLRVGNLVWEDLNNDGKRSSNEPGIGGVTVELLNGGTVVGTTTTTGDGNYLFTDLTAGSYVVRVTTPNGLTSSTGRVASKTGPVEPAPQTNDDDTDHGTTAGGFAVTQSLTLFMPGSPNNPDTDGTANLRQDFGFYRPLALGDVVFEDGNNNGKRDPGEAGLTGLTVELLSNGGVLASTTTGKNGDYRFDNLASGTYVVRVARPAGFRSSTGAFGQANGPFEPAPQTNDDNTDHGTDAGAFSVSPPVVLNPAGNPDENGTANLRQDFGLFRPLAVGNFVWDDVNNNGTFDAGESSLGDVPVDLLNGGKVVASTKTTLDGSYRFDNLTTGTYTVRVALPTGYISSTGINGSRTGPFEPITVNSQTDGVDHGTGIDGFAVTAPFELTLTGNPDENGAANLRQDFGLFRPLRVGTTVFLDANNNGKLDNGETGIPNVPVRLRTTAGQLVAQTVTDAGGAYLFTNLTPGEYFVDIDKVGKLSSSSGVPNQVTGPFELSPGQVLPPNPSDEEDKGNTDAPGQTIRTRAFTLFAPGSSGNPDANGTANLRQDFGLLEILPPVVPPPPAAPAQVAGFVYRDTFQRNGIRQPANGESGIAGVLVTLQNAAGEVVGTTRTDSNGFYQFTNLPAGTYTILETQPLAFTDGLDAVGSVGGTNPRSDVLTVTLAPGDAGVEYNFGEVFDLTVFPPLPPPATVPPVVRPGLTDPTKQNFLGSSSQQSGGQVIEQPPSQSPPLTVGQLTPRFSTNTGRGDTALVASGAGVGLPPTVRVFDYATGTEKFRFDAYESSFTGGVRVATADVDGDGVEDIITGTGVGGGPRMRVFSGRDGTQIREFFAFESTFRGGVFVAAGDIDGDGMADIVVGAEVGGGPRITTFSGRDGSILNNFFAFDATQRGGTRVGVGDFNGDGRADIVASTGAGVPTRVRVFDGTSVSRTLVDFVPFETAFTGGVNLAVGDVNGDGVADIITGAEAGGGPRIQTFDGRNQQSLNSFFAFGAGFTGGVRLAAQDVNGDGRADIVAGSGLGQQAQVRIFSSGDPSVVFEDFFAYDGTGGVYVG